MKKNLSFAFAVMSFAALTMFSSCQKDETVVTRFEATIANISGNSKTVLDGLNLYWVPGDRIKVYDASKNIGVYESTDPAKTSPFDLVYGNVVENSTYRAIYPASAGDNAGHLVLPLDQRTTDGSLTEFPMYAESRTAEPSLEFDNLCGVICFKLQEPGVSVSSIEVTTDKQLTGTFSISNNDGLSLTGNSGSNSVTLTCSTPQSISSQKSFYMYVPANEFKFMRIRIYSNDGHVCTKTLNAGTTFIVERGKITPLTLNSNNLDFSSVAGELPGLFSIGKKDNGEKVKVRFSSGNMQYTTVGTHAVADGTAKGTWRFAPNQYDYIGKDNENISETYTGWIDLFGWGTSGWNSGAVSYSPYDYSESGTGWNFYPGGSTSSNLTGDYAYADWAVYNAISNGGNAPRMWRNLTKEEWLYLVFTRDPDVKLRGTGNVNGVGGMILLPDDWNMPENCSFSPGFSNSTADWSHNKYTLEEWGKMEAAGAVFLPAAGYRSQQSGNPFCMWIQQNGYYWSTTRHNNNQAVDYLYYSWKDIGYPNLNQMNLCHGLSVRPVRVITSSQQ